MVDGTRWLAVFPLLAAIVGVWVAQAIHAHRSALERGYAPGGELRVMLLIGLAVLVLTGYWLVGGRHGSPGATLAEYLDAWQSGRAEEAAPLLIADPSADELRSAWADQDRQLRDAVANAAAVYGGEAGLDPQQPFNSLRFTEADKGTAGEATINVDLVRLQRVESSVLGVVPTARQQTVVVDRQLVIRLALVPQPGLAWLPDGILDSFSWEISSIDPG